MKVQRLKRRGKQLGLSIIELLIVLAVVAGIIAAILVRQQSIEQGQQATRVTDNVMALASAIRNVGANQSYDGLTPTTLTTLKMAPASLKPDVAAAPTKYSDATGVTYEFEAGTGGFVIKLTMSSSDLCTKVATALQNGPEAMVGKVVTIANGVLDTTTTAANVLKKDATATFSTANLATVCTGTSNVLGLQFR